MLNSWCNICNGFNWIPMVGNTVRLNPATSIMAGSDGLATASPSVSGTKVVRNGRTLKIERQIERQIEVDI